jgi:hypothetical protein
MDILFEMYKSGNGIYWPPMMHVLLRRIFEAKYIAIHHDPRVATVTAGMRLSPDIIRLTAEGRAFLDELGITEL